MTDGSDHDESFVRLGEVVARIAEVVRAKRRRRAATGRVVDLDTPPAGKQRATVAALAVLSQAGVIDPGTGARLLRRALAVSDLPLGDPDPCEDVRNPSGKPDTRCR